MRVEVVRFGGIAGVRLRGAADTDELVAEAAERAKGAITSIPAHKAASLPPHPESFRYELTIEDGKDRRVIDLDESEVPGELWPLIELAVKRAELA